LWLGAPSILAFEVALKYPPLGQVLASASERRTCLSPSFQATSGQEFSRTIRKANWLQELHLVPPAGTEKEAGAFDEISRTYSRHCMDLTGAED